MRDLIEAFESRFDSLNTRSTKLLSSVSTSELFQKPERFESSFEMFSCGEFILRSAAAIEQTFSGITTRLWDDPFEWTLPEYMSSPGKIAEYLDEVSYTCRRGFAFLDDDNDLKRQIPAPRELKPIVDILLRAYEKGAFFQGKAIAVCQLIGTVKRPGMGI